MNVIDADFCMKVSDDSMKKSRILKDDIVFVKRRKPAEKEIAVVSEGDIVRIGKLVISNGCYILFPENENYEPVLFKTCPDVLGTVVAFQSVLTLKGD